MRPAHRVFRDAVQNITPALATRLPRSNRQISGKIADRPGESARWQINVPRTTEDRTKQISKPVQLERQTSVSVLSLRVGQFKLNAVRLIAPVTLTLFQGGALSNEDSNIPRSGVQSGRTVTFVTSISVQADGTARNVVFTDTMSGPIEIQSLRTYHESGTCQFVQKTVTCRLPGPGSDHVLRRGGVGISRTLTVVPPGVTKNASLTVKP
jgi:hypothetical protein